MLSNDPFYFEQKETFLEKMPWKDLIKAYNTCKNADPMDRMGLAAYGGEIERRIGKDPSKINFKIESYKFEELKICTDGSMDYYGQANHQPETAYYLGSYKNPIYIDPTKVHYVVIPVNYNGDAKLGDIAVVIDHSTGKRVNAIVGDKGPKDKYEEVSISAAWDLGYKTDGTYGPEGDFEFMIIPGSKVDWGTNIDTLQSKIDEEVKKYF